MANTLHAFVQSNERIDAARWHIIAVVTDDQTKAQVDVITSSLAELKRVLRSTQLQVETSKELDALVPGMDIDLTIPPPPPPPDPSPDEVAVNEFTALVTLWRQATTLVTYGFEPEGFDTQPKTNMINVYTKATDELKSKFAAALPFKVL